MKRTLITGIVALAILCLLLAVAGCASGPSLSPASPPVTVSSGQNTDDITGSPPSTPVSPLNRTLIVGIDSNYEPFSYRDPNGFATGFDVDSMKWIASKKGLTIIFLPVAWDGIIPALRDGQIDIIYSAMTITPERAGQVNFSTTYWEVNQDVVVKSESVITMEDMKAGKIIIGTQKGSTASQWIDKNLIATNKIPPNQLKQYANTSLALNDLEKGKVDAVMQDDLVLRAMNNGRPVRIIGTITTKEEVGIAVRKTDPELLAILNDGLTQLKADPYWQELIRKYQMK